MINEALTFLNVQLGSYIRVQTGNSEDVVGFVENSKRGEISLRKNAITLLLTSIEEERLFRAGMAPGNSSEQGGKSGLPLNLFVLFACQFENYNEGLQYLSLVLSFFQGKPTLNHQNSPDLSPNIEKLNIELQNLTIFEQKALWQSLRLPYQPSVLYKVRMVVIKDSESPELIPVVTQTQLKTAEPQTPPTAGGGKP